MTLCVYDEIKKYGGRTGQSYPAKIRKKSREKESAILAVLVLMIGQVVFSNIMFTVTGAAATISNIIVCRWGMGALGASTDLNSRMAWLQAGLDGPMYDATVENLTHSWQMLGLISVVCLVAAWLVLQIAFDKKKV